MAWVCIFFHLLQTGTTPGLIKCHLCYNILDSPGEN